MATETGPDLTFGQQVMETLMDDTCRVYELGEEVYNPVTRQLEAAEIDVYEGKCAVFEMDAERKVEAGIEADMSGYEVELPLEVTEVKNDHILKVLTARRDPMLVGLTLRIIRPVRETFVVSRTLICVVDR